MATKRAEVSRVRLSIDVDEATWRKLRDAAEREREAAGGKASVNALVGRLIDAYLAQKGGR